MRIVRLRHPEGPRPGIVVDGRVHLTSTALPSMDDRTGETIPLADAELLVPVEPSKIMCVGRNYVDHIDEMGFERPDRPALFMKPPTALLATGGDVMLPEDSDHVEHEAELAVVIGRGGRYITAEDAFSHVFGFTCADDVSARDLQAVDSGVIRAKGFDTFCPLGPWVETELDIRSGRPIRCSVNGQLRQDGDTSNLLFDVPFLISYLSRFTTLLPGDVILTGSPGGSGRLEPGDRVEIEVEGLGVLQHGVQAAPRSGDGPDPGRP